MPRQIKMNVRLLNLIAKWMLTRWAQADMGYWFRQDESAGPCKTTACIAGAALALMMPPRKRKPLFAARALRRNFATYGHCDVLGGYDSFLVLPKAKNILGLDREKAGKLLYTDGWPARFKNRLFKKVPGTKGYARVVHDRILHFIATNGAE